MSLSRVILLYFLGLQPRDKAAMLVVNTIQFFSRRIYMKIEFSSQRREMLLFLTTKMAAVKSRVNQQLEELIVTLATIGLQGKGKGIPGRSWDWDTQCARTYLTKKCKEFIINK